MYLIQTVNSRPRVWSSHSNICTKDDVGCRMSSVDNIPGFRGASTYYCSSTSLRKTAATTYDFPEHPPKKDKKWSLGSLFRRKKKEESDSSSGEECDKKGFLGRRKRHKRKKPNKQRPTFDHVVISTCNGHDNGILSDPAGGFAGYIGRHCPSKSNTAVVNGSGNITDVAHMSMGSADSLNKKQHRKSRTKVRAEARREQNKRDTSSDDDSQRSASSSRFRSDENVGKSRDSSLNRKSRAARTERYIRRLSKDEEAVLNRERKAQPCNVKTEFNTPPSASPVLRETPSVSSNQAIVSGLFTIPPSHGNQIRNKPDVGNAYHKVSNSAKYNSLTNGQKNQISYQRSVSYDADIHKSTSPESPTVLHVRFPLSSRPINGEQPRIYKHPPPPPPRDPWRLVSVPHSDNIRPVSYCFERAGKANEKAKPKPHSFNWLPNHRSTSDDHLATESSNVTVQARPSSAASDHYIQRLIKRPPNTNPDDFRYLTEKNPRSRKPIVIQTHQSQLQSEPQNALSFWKQKDQDEVSRMHLQQPRTSPLMFTAQTRVRTKVFLPSVVKSNTEAFVEKRSSSPFKPISPPVEKAVPEVKPTADEPQVTSRKSSNLEEALDELEAIYNSLRLGDEDLLDRAEEREQSIAAKKLQKSKDEPYPGWNIPRGAISDSGFNYEPFDSIDSPKRKRLLKKGRLIDRRSDDMAYRKLNKERKESGDSKEAVSKISYLLSSPIHGPDEVDADTFKSQSKEPDITFDDVVYRNVKYSKSSLKVCDPQPPFGIPTGPILPGSNSDYLHAVPENVGRKNKKMPDLVKDDLAYRNLRKDSHKDPVLPPLLPDGHTNNNDSIDFNALKKKRAVRSLSANLYNLIQNQTFKLRVNEPQENNDLEKSSLADIADAMEIARKILKEKEHKISETRRTFLSDTEAKYRKHAVNDADNATNERRLNFLNDMKTKGEECHQKVQVNVPKNQDSFLFSKPPSGIISDKKTPPIAVNLDIEANPLDTLGACNRSLEELLNAFAVEADEASKQISRELELPKTEMVATTKTESTPIEEVERFSPTPIIQESLANIVITHNVDLCRATPNPITSEVHSESEHDYVNLGSDFEKDIPMIDESCDESKCMSPFEEHKSELVAGFQELVRDALEKENDGNDGLDDGKTGKGEMCDLNPDALTPTKQECAFLSKACVNVSDKGIITSYITDCDIQCSSHDWFVPKYTRAATKLKPSMADLKESNFKIPRVPRHDSLCRSRSSSGFHSISSVSDAEPNLYFSSDDDMKMENSGFVRLESLESPKLVLKSDIILHALHASTQTETQNESLSNQGDVFRRSRGKPPVQESSGVKSLKFLSSQKLRGLNNAANFGLRRNGACEEEKPGTSSTHDSRHTLDASEPTRSWYSDPVVLAFACSYGFACTYQLVSLDAVTILGLLFVIVSFVAALTL